MIPKFLQKLLDDLNSVSLEGEPDREVAEGDVLVGCIEQPEAVQRLWTLLGVLTERHRMMILTERRRRMILEGVDHDGGQELAEQDLCRICEMLELSLEAEVLENLTPMEREKLLEAGNRYGLRTGWQVVAVPAPEERP